MNYEEALETIRYEVDEECHCGYIEDELRLAMTALEKQIPKKVCFDNENGIYETEYCPTCHRRLMPNEHHCRCGQALDWSGVK